MMSHLIVPKAKPLHFGANSSSGAKAVAPSFQMSKMNRRLLDRFDFKDAAISHVHQVQLIYLMVILWRVLAANDRRRKSDNQSWNEVREIVIRDSVGFTFWFFAVPLLQRLYLKALVNRDPQLKNRLMQINSSTNRNPWNLLQRWQIPSSQQIRDQMTQILADMKQAGIQPNEGAYQKTHASYQRLLKHRNLASALGLSLTILLLGVGINLLNFYLTRRNMAQQSY